MHSIEEDSYGVVQRSFESIVGSLLGASMALEEFAHTCNGEPSQSSRPPSIDYNVLTLSNVFDLALYQIVSKFYVYLKDFSFPHDYAVRLRQYAAFDQ